ncbi:MAG TPA: aldo/keto reductase, partial [Pseudonocardia sp.]|nr:aldo/keto reductase [Pseudonocardia sp.]
LSSVPYYGLAKGFLTGKYRDGGPEVDSPRAEGALAYLDDRGRAVLAVLDEIAAGHEVAVAAVALAWLAAQPTVVAPIASARNTGQLADLLPVLDLKLTDDEVRLLAHVST